MPTKILFYFISCALVMQITAPDEPTTAQEGTPSQNTGQTPETQTNSKAASAESSAAGQKQTPPSILGAVAENLKYAANGIYGFIAPIITPLFSGTQTAVKELYNVSGETGKSFIRTVFDKLGSCSSYAADLFTNWRQSSYLQPSSKPENSDKPAETKADEASNPQVQRTETPRETSR